MPRTRRRPIGIVNVNSLDIRDTFDPAPPLHVYDGEDEARRRAPAAKVLDAGDRDRLGSAMAILGIIADDFTGATDIAGMLVKGGMRTIQTIGVPAKGTIPDDVDAVVVALKTRSIAAKDAIAQSLDALKALQAAGCVRFFFKYCSTFDSTDDGNIGPVGDALLDALDGKQAIYCPAFPENGRTIFFGHLFVGDLLLSDTHMRHHPLNPMTDSSLVRVLARQTKHKVGLVALKQVQAGSATLRAALDKLAADGVRHVDRRCRGRHRSRHHRRGDRRRRAGHRRLGRGARPARRLSPARADARTRPMPTRLPKVAGAAAVLAGSCSAATLGQIAAFKGPHLALDTDAICRGEPVGEKALAWAKDKLGNGPILLSASDKPEAVKALQAKYGVEKSSQAIEKHHGDPGARAWSRPASAAWSSRAARPRAPWSARST